jgi:hypothetical protein
VCARSQTQGAHQFRVAHWAQRLSVQNNSHDPRCRASARRARYRTFQLPRVFSIGCCHLWQSTEVRRRDETSENTEYVVTSARSVVQRLEDRSQTFLLRCALRCLRRVFESTLSALRSVAISLYRSQTSRVSNFARSRRTTSRDPATYRQIEQRNKKYT